MIYGTILLMDNQVSSPNSPSPAERPSVSASESFRAPVGLENAAASTGAAPIIPAPKLTAADVAAVIAATPTVGTSTPQTPAPLVAGDVDVIEPEWVDKAEAVIREHHDDPYAEEEAIEKLQEEYLQKRYGITVADPNADDTKPKGT